MLIGLDWQPYPSRDRTAVSNFSPPTSLQLVAQCSRSREEANHQVVNHATLTAGGPCPLPETSFCRRWKSCTSEVVEGMDVLKVVQQLRDLAADPQNRATIVRDQGCLPGLVIFLDNDNPEVILTALEALFYLAQVPSNRPLMRNEMGLVISVRRIINRQRSPPELKSSAQKVHDLLIPPAGSSRPMSQSRYGGARNNVFLGASNRKARSYILQVEGLNDEDSRRQVEEHLLTVKGVISFTFNMPQHRCVVRVRSDLKPEVLCRALESSGRFGAQQVVKDDRGDEVLLSFGPGSPAKGGKENTPVKLPEYLPEDTAKERTDDKAVERSGAVEGGGGWFGGMRRYLSETFYW